MTTPAMERRSIHRDPDDVGPAGEGPLTEAPLIYFSSVSDNTHRFVGKLGFEAARMPLVTK